MGGGDLQLSYVEHAFNLNLSTALIPFGSFRIRGDRKLPPM